MRSSSLPAPSRRQSYRGRSSGLRGEMDRRSCWTCAFSSSRLADFNDDIACVIEPRCAIRWHHCGALVFLDDERTGTQLAVERGAREHWRLVLAVRRPEVNLAA